MVKVYCSHCGRFSWDIDMVLGRQNVTCPQCRKKTTILIEKSGGELKINSRKYSGWY